MRFNTTFAATLLVLGVVTPAYAETETLPEAALAAEREYVASASACVTQALPEINALHFPAQIAVPNQMPPPAAAPAGPPATSAAPQEPVPACP